MTATAGRPAGLRELAGFDEMVEASGGSPFVRFAMGHVGDGAAYALGSAVALPRRTHLRRSGLLVMGGADDAAQLVEWLVAGSRLPEPPVNLTVQRQAMVAVEPVVAAAAAWRVARATEWDWMCTTTLPPAVPGEELLILLAESDEAEIRSLLDEGNPGTDARPFESAGQQWVGARDGSGRLVACGVVEPDVSGRPLLQGITVAPTHRGRGLGLAVTAYLTRLGVSRDGFCSLGMYADNDVARRVYLGLGYGDVHEWSSRRLEPRLEPAPD